MVYCAFLTHDVCNSRMLSPQTANLFGIAALWSACALPYPSGYFYVSMTVILHSCSLSFDIKRQDVV